MLLTTILSSVVIGIYLREYIIINIHGTVDVPVQNAIERDLQLFINTTFGSQNIDLGEVELTKSGCIQLKGFVTSVNGDIKLVLSGKLRLTSINKSYEISMPCLAEINESCYRVKTIIPGYDTPLEVASGVYNATLELSWIAWGNGSFTLRLIVLYGANNN